MRFRVTVIENTPLTPIKDLDHVLSEFLQSIEYLPRGYKPRTAAMTLKESVPYRLFKECLLLRASRGWTIDELTTTLGTSRVTVYRHIRKLMALGLLERGKRSITSDNGSVELTTYRFKQGDLLKAWMSAEENINNALRNYRMTVEHIQGLVKKKVDR